MTLAPRARLYSGTAALTNNPSPNHLNLIGRNANREYIAVWASPSMATSFIIPTVTWVSLSCGMLWLRSLTAVLKSWALTWKNKFEWVLFKCATRYCRSDCHCAAVIADRKSTRLNSSHLGISYAVFCLKKKKNDSKPITLALRTRTMTVELTHTYRC